MSKASVKKKPRKFKYEEIYVKYDGVFIMHLRKELDQDTGKKMFRIIDIHIIM